MHSAPHVVGVRERTVLTSAIVVVLAVPVIVVGVIWFGWYKTRQNRALLGALPVYPDAEAVKDHPPRTPVVHHWPPGEARPA